MGMHSLLPSVQRTTLFALVLGFITACGGGSDSSGSGGSTPTNYTVTASSGSGGSISPGSRSVQSGQTTTFTVSANDGYSIDSVTGCGGSLSGSTYTTSSITANCTVTASFSLNSYTVTATAGDGGSISPESMDIPYGSTGEFTVTPVEGYEIERVTGCDGALDGNTYTTGIITEPCEVNTQFKHTRYTVHGDGTVTDLVTGLMWSQCSVRQSWEDGACTGSASTHRWQQALDLAEQANVAGYTDWRVPTIDELKSLVYCSSGSTTYWKTHNNQCFGSYSRPTIMQSVFTNTPSNWFWSSSPYARVGSNSAWAVHFDDGLVGNHSKGDDAQVRLVRAGQLSAFGLQVEKSGSGEGVVSSSPAVIHCGSRCSADFVENTTVTLSATPAEGSRSVVWEGACIGTGNTCTLTMSEAKKAWAIFDTESSGEHTVVAQSSPGGSISPQSVSVTAGETAAFTLTPDAHYHIAEVTGCSGSLSGSTYTTGAINGACVVTANFALDRYELTATAGANGTVSPETADVEHGGSFRFTITPDTGYGISEVTGCPGTRTALEFEAGPITAPCALAVEFYPLAIVQLDNTTATERVELTWEATSNALPGQIVSWQWEQLSGPQFDVHSADSRIFSATPPAIEQPATARFRVTATDANGFDSSAEADVQIASFVRIALALDDKSVAEGKLIEWTVTNNGGLGEIVSYQWEQISGPFVHTLVSDTDVLSATTPFVGADAIALFRVTAEDIRGFTSYVEANLTIQPFVPDTVALTVNVSLPAEVTSISPADITASALQFDNLETFDRAEPSLFVGQDADGLVLYAIANNEGGFLSEGYRQVTLSPKSTMLAITTLAAGYPVSALTQEIADSILEHAVFQELEQGFVALLEADKNALVRLATYPDLFRLAQQIATTVPALNAPQMASSAFYSADPWLEEQRQAAQFFSVSAVNQDELGTVKDDFYSSRAMNSPWAEHQPWIWFGDAKGAEVLNPANHLNNIRDWVNMAFNPLGFITVKAYTALLDEATALPFLARARDIPRGTNNVAVHAFANPNYADYAVEAFSAGSDTAEFFMLAPRNATMIKKMLNSGAAFKQFETGHHLKMNPDIERLRFTRYRFSKESEAAVMVSLLNTLKLGFSAMNVVGDFAPLANYLDNVALALAADAAAVVQGAAKTELMLNVAKCAEALEPFMFAPPNTNMELSMQAAAALGQAGSLFSALETTPSCRKIAVKGGLEFGEMLVKAKLSSAFNLALVKLTVGLKAVFDAGNDLVPVSYSYFSPAVAGVDYYLTWLEEDSTPYISQVSTRQIPQAQFSYEQLSDQTIRFDASASTHDPATSLSYQWLSGAWLLGQGKVLQHRFDQVGVNPITLRVTDGFDRVSNYTMQVRVFPGRLPEIKRLTCTLDNGDLTMRLHYEDSDNRVTGINWYANLSDATPTRITSVDETEVVLAAWASGAVWAKVALLTNDGDSTGVQYSETCLARQPIAGRYVVHGDGTVSDITTNLMWQQCSVGQGWLPGLCTGSASTHTWQSSFNQANNSQVAGYSDWRLPTREELASLVYCSSGQPEYWKGASGSCGGSYDQPTIYSQVFPNTPSNWFWSSSPSAGSSGNAQLVGFALGNVAGNVKSSNGRVRLVRAGQSLGISSLRLQKYGSGRVHGSGAGGSIDCGSGCSSDQVSLDAGGEITLNANAASGHRFVRWEGDCTGSGGCTLTMDRDRQVVAIFQQNTTNRTLSVSKTGSGQGRVTSNDGRIDCGSSCSATYTSSTTVTLTATPDSGYTFGGWSGACGGSGTTCTVTMSASRSVTAQFIDGIVRNPVLGACEQWIAATSGGHGETIDNWDISTIPQGATFDIQFNAFSIPDKFVVSYQGSVRYDSGWRGSSSYNGNPLYPGGIAGPGQGQKDDMFNKSSTNTFRVNVFGPEQGTAWNYSIRCRE